MTEINYRALQSRKYTYRRRKNVRKHYKISRTVSLFTLVGILVLLVLGSTLYNSKQKSMLAQLNTNLQNNENQNNNNLLTDNNVNINNNSIIGNLDDSHFDQNNSYVYEVPLFSNQQATIRSPPSPGINVSQYNVTETSVFQDQKHALFIGNSVVGSGQNTTLEYPNNTYNSSTIEVSEVLKSFNRQTDGTISSSTTWFSYTDPTTAPGFNQFGWDMDNTAGELSIHSGGYNALGDPAGNIYADNFAEWYQTATKFDKGINVTKGEFLAPGEEVMVNGSDFVDNSANFTKLYDNPYGGETQDATTLLDWTPDYVYSDIKAGDSLFRLGSPSIAWSAEYSVPENYKQVKLVIGWSLDNKGYEADDGVAVIARVDGTYVDGRTGFAGEPYGDATNDTLENEDFDVSDHGLYSRWYDVTDLINTTIGASHSFDFGVKMSSPDETDDEVIVYFDYAALYFIGEDIYKIGEIQFDLNTFCENNSGNNNILKSMVLFSIFSNGNQDYSIVYGTLYDLFNAGNLDGSGNSNIEDYTYNLTSDMLPYVDVDTFYYTFGIYVFEDIQHTDFFGVDIDNIFLRLLYKQSHYDWLNLNVTNGHGWNPVTTSTPILFTEPTNSTHNSISFVIGNLTWANSWMKYNHTIYLVKESLNGAIADYSSNIWNTTYVSWVVKYNNTDSINDLYNCYYGKAEALGYNITISNLPAWDGLGSNSLDWEFKSIVAPEGVNFNDKYMKTNGTNSVSTRQNLTIIDATFEFNGYYLNGTFECYYDQPNYLSNLYLNDSIYRYYQGENLNYSATITQFSYLSEIFGTYNVSIYNSSDTIVSGFPLINADYSGNLTSLWNVSDSDGLGEYSIRIMWINTTASGNVERVGFRDITFNIYKHTQSGINSNPSPNPLNTGTTASMEIYYNTTIPNVGIENASIAIYNNATGRLWGKDWSPYIYQYDNSTLTYLGSGNYTFDIGTNNIPSGNYTLKIIVRRLNYDPQIFYTQLNITGYPMTVAFTSGVVNLSGSYYLSSWNIPIVHKSNAAVIQINVTNATGDPIRYASVTGTFNGSEIVSKAFEVYSKTFNPSDKGIYNLTIDTTDLNSTDYDSIANYTLRLAIAAPTYSSERFNISCSITRAPSEISTNTISNEYEGGSLEIFTQFMEVVDPELPTPIEGGSDTFTNVSYIIQNSTTSFCGNLSYVAPNSGVYTTEIDFTNMNGTGLYLYPGIYNISIIGQAWNVLDSNWTQNTFEVLPKTTSAINITLSDPVRIGSTLEVKALLYNVSSNDPLAGESLSLRIIYEGISFDVSGTTDSNGIVEYSQIVPQEYNNTLLIVNVTYSGSTTIHPSFSSKNTTILPRIPVNLTWAVVPDPNRVRVGYSLTLQAQLSILGVSEYNDRFITLTVFYDGDKNPIFQKGRCNASGYVNFTLDTLLDNYSNITFYIEFSGTSTEAYAINKINYDIIPKWETLLSISDLRPDIRVGQQALVNISASFIDNSSWESFYGLPAEISFKDSSGALINEYTKYFSENQTIIFNYTIPESLEGECNIFVYFEGTTILQNSSTSKTITILPKWSVSISINNLTNEIHLGDTIQAEMKVSFVNDSALGWDSLIGKNISITLHFEKYFVEFKGKLNENNSYIISYTIPLDAGNSLTIDTSFEETTTIKSVSASFSISLLPQIGTQIILLTNNFQEDYAGDFHVSAKLLDENNNPLSNQELIFIVKDSTGYEVGRYSAVTNELGIATVTISLETVDEYTVDVYYPTEGIYATSTGDQSTIRVVNLGIKIIDNWDKITLAIGSAVALGIIIRQTVIVPKRKRYLKALKMIHQRFSDAENIQYVLISHLHTGLSLFSHAFSEVPIDETLISGFLSAITSFGAEISEKVQESSAKSTQDNAMTPEDMKGGTSTQKLTNPTAGSGLQELAYKQFKIAVFDGKYVRTALLLLKSSSPSLKQKAKEFNTEFEKQYEDVLANFKGKSLDHNPILELIEQIFNADLLYVHYAIRSKLNQVPKKDKLANLIIKELGKPEFNYSFKIRDIINHMIGFGIRDVDTFNAIERLRQQRIVFAVNPRTQALIDQFNPIISALSESAKKFLLLLFKGIKDQSKLMKETGIKDLTDLVLELQNQQLLNEDGSINEIGGAIATLLSLIPDL